MPQRGLRGRRVDGQPSLRVARRHPLCRPGGGAAPGAGRRVHRARRRALDRLGLGAGTHRSPQRGRARDGIRRARRCVSPPRGPAGRGGGRHGHRRAQLDGSDQQLRRSRDLARFERPRSGARAGGGHHLAERRDPVRDHQHRARLSHGLRAEHRQSGGRRRRRRHRYGPRRRAGEGRRALSRRPVRRRRPRRGARPCKPAGRSGSAAARGRHPSRGGARPEPHRQARGAERLLAGADRSVRARFRAFTEAACGDHQAAGGRRRARRPSGVRDHLLRRGLHPGGGAGAGGRPGAAAGAAGQPRTRARCRATPGAGSASRTFAPSARDSPMCSGWAIASPTMAASAACTRRTEGPWRIWNSPAAARPTGPRWSRRG